MDDIKDPNQVDNPFPVQQGLDNVSQPVSPVVVPEVVQPKPEKEEQEVDWETLTIPADFDDEQVSRARLKIETEMSRIKLEYDEEQWFAKCGVYDSAFKGLNTEDTEYSEEDNEYDVKLFLMRVLIETLAQKTYDQSYTPNPTVIIESGEVPKPKDSKLQAPGNSEEDESEILRQRAERLDFYAKTGAKLKEIEILIYTYTICFGNCVVETVYDNRKENKKFKTIYEPTPEGIAKYEAKYIKELVKGTGKVYSDYEKLTSRMASGDKTPVAKIEDKEVTVFDGAKVSIVAWDKFFARPSEKNFWKQALIGKRFKKTYYDLKSNVAAGFWDKDAVQKIIDQGGTDAERKDYYFYEYILLFDKEENGKTERFLITQEENTKEFVQEIYYPYDHMIYTVYNLSDRKNSWLGNSLSDLILDLSDLANSVVNSFIKEQDLAHTPLIVSNGKMVGDWTIIRGKANLLQVDLSGAPQNSQIQQYKLEGVATDRIAFLQWIISYSAILTGIDLALLSGASDPNDKRAPAAKTAMKMQASTNRMEYKIQNLQKGDCEVFKNIESVMYQFQFDKDLICDPKFADRKVKHVMAGSKMSFDRTRDLQVIMGTVQFIKQFFMEAWTPENEKILFSALLSNSQGTVEKLKDQLIKPFEMIIAAKQEQEKNLKALQAKAEAEGKGEMFKKFLQAQSGGGKPQGGQPPQGKPPMPAPGVNP